MYKTILLIALMFTCIQGYGDIVDTNQKEVINTVLKMHLKSNQERILKSLVKKELTLKRYIILLENDPNNPHYEREMKELEIKINAKREKLENLRILESHLEI